MVDDCLGFSIACVILCVRLRKVKEENGYVLPAVSGLRDVSVYQEKPKHMPHAYLEQLTQEGGYPPT